MFIIKYLNINVNLLRVIHWLTFSTKVEMEQYSKLVIYDDGISYFISSKFKRIFC